MVVIKMRGNISKVIGELGSTGPQGKQGIQGVKGDTPSITFVLDDNGDLYYTSDGILLDKEYADSNNYILKSDLEPYATKEFVTQLLLELTNKVAPSPATITLYKDRWKQVEGKSMWYQVIEVANAEITPYSKIDLQLSAEQIITFYEKDLAFVVENDNCTVTVYSIGRVPENDNYVINATVSEVLVNG